MLSPVHIDAGNPTSARRPLFAVRTVVFLFLLLVWPHPGWTAQVTVRARLSAPEIYLGESVTFEVRVAGLRDPVLSDLYHPDIDVTPEGGQSFSNSSISIINGRTSRIEEFGYVARYTLRPRATGALHIPPVAVTHEGRTYHSQPVTLVVRRPSQQDRLLVEVYTNKPSYVLGERVTLTLDVSLRKLTIDGTVRDLHPFFPAQPPHLEIPWFDRLGDWKTADLKAFAQPFLKKRGPGFTINDYYDSGSLFRKDPLTFSLPRRSTKRVTPTGIAEYFTYQLQKTFQPLRAGEQRIPPALVKALLPTKVNAHGRVIRRQKIVASSAPLTVNIHPVPSVGRPASFSGAVGRFALDIDAMPKVLKVGDPLTLTMTLRGEGGSLLETVHPVSLHDQAAVVRDFKVHTDQPSVKTAEDAKTFTYTLRPRRAGVRAVPPIEVAYYDPHANRFHILRSDPVPLHVEGASTLPVSDVVTTAADREKNILGRELAEGILANYTGVEVLVPQHTQLHVTPFTSALLVFPPVAYVLALFSRQWLRRRRQEPGRQRSRKAEKQALIALRALKGQATADDTAICDGVYRMLTRYMSDKLNLTGAGLTVDDVTRHLQTRRLDAELIDQTTALLHRCDGVRYAPGTLAVAQLTGIIEDAETLVRRLEASGRL